MYVDKTLLDDVHKMEQDIAEMKCAEGHVVSCCGFILVRLTSGSFLRKEMFPRKRECLAINKHEQPRHSVNSSRFTKFNKSCLQKF